MTVDVGAARRLARLWMSQSFAKHVGILQPPIWNQSSKKKFESSVLKFPRSSPQLHNFAMAPTKPSKGKGKPGGKSSGSKGGPKGGAKSKSAGSAPSGISKRKAKGLALSKPGGALKTKSWPIAGKKKKRVYTEAELDIPKLNGIIPAGIAKPHGQKKGKTFVDDAESMMAIMSMVNANREGQVESKIMRARQLEEVREAKRKEAEKRSDQKKAKFEETKEGLKKKKKSRHSDPGPTEDVETEEPRKEKKARKRVSFG